MQIRGNGLTIHSRRRRFAARLNSGLELIMKLPTVKNLACLIMLLAIRTASAACAIDDPAAVAKAFYSKHSNFSSDDPAKIKKLITPRLFDALNREYKCAQGQICALEAD